MSTRQSKRKWEEKVKSIEELASLYKRRPLCERYKPQLSKPWQPSSVWKLFHRQNQAFDFAKSCKEDVHVFALESSAENKQRFYLVTTYPELWFYYSKHRETSLMHCYEVIPETAVCKLYFDLEFYKPANKGADGKQMVAVLIEFVCEKLDEHYGVKCSAGDILNLDSSTEDKFSCHLIFQLHNAAFKNNIHIGYFLKRILESAIRLIKNKEGMAVEKEVFSASRSSKVTTDLPNCLENQIVSNNVPPTCQLNSQRAMEKGTPQQTGERDLSFLIVNSKQGGSQLFVDLGVYTKNRNFRLYKSSKAGKCAVLDIAEDNKFIPKPVKNSSVEEQFSDCIKIMTFDTPEARKEKSVCSNGNMTNSCIDSIEGYHCSPYPEIDSFVLSLVSKDNVRGGIRRWNYFSLEQLLVYDILNYRWCRNIGRAHKSNNIMIIVDLKQENWYQKCHDPICRAENFKSESFPLPSEVCLPFLFKEDEEYEYIMDECGNIEEKSKMYNPTIASSGGTSLAFCSDPDATKRSSLEWDDEADIIFLEASEDVELAEAAASFQPQRDWIVDEIPDELLVDALQNHEINE